MTEADWLACTEPKRMLDYLRGKGSDRKLRLFACACSYQVKHLMTESRSLMALDVGERFADGLAAQEELFQAHKAAFDAAADAGRYMPGRIGNLWVLARDAARCAEQAARSASPTAGEAAFYGAYDTIRVFKAVSGKCPTLLLRDIFGNPFRPPSAISHGWTAWNAGTVVKVAQAIYEERAFDRLPILADALEDAGCYDTDILEHCRQPMEHMRGCWVVDLLLGKK